MLPFVCVTERAKDDEDDDGIKVLEDQSTMASQSNDPNQPQVMSHWELLDMQVLNIGNSTKFKSLHW